MEQLGNVFTQADADDHFSDHVIGMEIDHLSDKTGHQGILDSADKGICPKPTQMIAHGNMPSSRHEMTKLILFRGT